MRIGIGITAWRRPAYFARVMDALSRNPGIGYCECFVSVDGGYPDAQEAVDGMFRSSGLPGEIALQDRNLGCTDNTGLVLRTLFDNGADAVVMLEDDTLPAVDFLHYMRVMLDRFRDDDRIFNISGHHRRVRRRDPDAPKAVEVSDTGDGWTRVSIDLLEHMFPSEPASVGEGRADAVFLRDGFNCHGWGTWRRIFEEIGPGWFGVLGAGLHELPEGEAFLRHVTVNSKGSWGFPMKKYWRRGRLEVAPDLSRICNIGEHGGMFNPDPEWHRRNVRTEIWMDGDEGYFGSFELIPDPSSPSDAGMAS